ncbi:quinone oxidoreductase [Micrococcus terreus]|uniref:quinone oxidoreductase family protein n=1 Tax=Micrococcus terreus TaxID=574650 RepID=UPI0021A8E48B|nr:quinone oxidoreductase [Micrococcus terreus]MCT2089180.1 quinone oxidoreductase [Micrococcus terreus]
MTENLPQTHHAVTIDQPGGPDGLTWSEVPVPQPGPGQVLVRTAAAGLNFIETYQRSGVYDVDYPFTPGSEGSGTVVALGEGVEGVEVGDRVATAAGTGTYAEHFVAPAEQLLPVPEQMDLQQASAVPLQGMTAHYLCRSTVEVGPDHTVLIHAGAGGVGLLLTQLCVSLGATVITTASTEAKRELSRQAGAAHVLEYEGFAEKVRELTDGQGVDVVYDGVGKDTFDASLESLRVRGTLVLFGGSSGQVPPFDLQRLNGAGALYVTRPSLAFYTRTAEETAWRAGELFEAIAAGTLDLRIGAQHPLAEAGRAHADLEERKTTGKVLLVP